MRFDKIGAFPSGANSSGIPIAPAPQSIASLLQPNQFPDAQLRFVHLSNRKVNLN